MSKYLWFVVVLPILLYANQYPLVYKKLSHPLYKSAPVITKLSSIDTIKKLSDAYNEAIQKTIDLGFKADKTHDSKSTKEYLFSLRKLQKKYDYILHSIHKEIVVAIENNDYKRFRELTEYEFDGLLKSRTLYKKSLAFYERHKHENKIKYFEKRIKYTRLEKASAHEFEDVVTTSTYNSNEKQKKKIVNLSVVDNREYLDVYIENTNPFSISVNVKGEYKNLNTNHSNTQVVAMKAGEKKKYLRLMKIKGALSYSYKFSYTWLLGSVSAVHNDEYIYRLPYTRGTSKKVSQGFNGTTTHKERSKYAVDFVMDVGTKIYAARNGVVVKLKEDSNKGGYATEFAKYGNFVTIEHDDSTFATYYHLRRNGVAVNVGDKVDRGSFIAYSGNTGYSSGPHLHFAVFKASNATSTKTIKIKFLSAKGIEHYIEKGVFYIAK